MFTRVEFENFCPPLAPVASTAGVEPRCHRLRQGLIRSGINFVGGGSQQGGWAGTSPCLLVVGRKDLGLTYRDKDNSNKTPLCIHRAPLGTHERCTGFLIGHYAGNFPLWLAPDQVRVIRLNDDKALINFAKPIVAELCANMVRVDADFSATPFNSDKSQADAKISNAEL